MKAPPNSTHLTVFHPSTLNEDARLMFGETPADAVGRARQAETDWLLGPARQLDSRSYTFITYADLAAKH